MSPEIRQIVTTAEQAVGRLVQQCRKTGPLYARNPRAVAQVNRTAKWLLNAVNHLKRELDTDTSPAA